ncbi:MAG TPA: Rrf2 family transcriptional regulator, partial [Gemmatimonadaceae bacterium]
MLLPQTAEYALRAVLHIAAHRNERPLRVNEIATALAVPRNYLAKTLHRLTQEGVLLSSRGPSGGFRLAVAPQELTLARVVAPFVAAGRNQCLLGDGPCGDTMSCRVHERWKPVARHMDA